jgi:uncharacterized protein YqjF (DUF2071 family)
MLAAYERRRGGAEHVVERPLFLADWCDVFFMHFEVPAAQLQPRVPFPLDLFHGRANVSLVAFTQRRLRLAFGGRLASALLAPIAEHEFLNLRTYVRAAETPGIYFLSEWIPNRLAELIGPRVYGLPYRHASLRYDNCAHRCSGRVRHRHDVLQYCATPSRQRRQATAGELDHFLLERYAAFTHHDGIARRFNVEHAPWTYASAAVNAFVADLLHSALAWPAAPHLVGAQFSTGVQNVKIGRPQIIAAPHPHGRFACC